MQKIKDFWLWFSEYHDTLYTVKAFTEREQHYYYNELTVRLEEIHPFIGFVLHAPGNGEKAQLIITTNGETEGMLYVIQLGRMAPKLPNWQIYTFIQPTISIKALKKGLEKPYEFKAFELRPSHIFWVPVDIDPDTYKYEFVFHFKGLLYRNLGISYETAIEYLIIILLDLLGEKRFNQQIKMIYYDDKGDSHATWYPLYQLPKYLKYGDLD
jgi:hypothetical protein